MINPIAIANFPQFWATITNQFEVIKQPLYDTQTYTSGTTTSLNFFQASSTNRLTSNMDSAGQLPQPSQFIITGFVIVPLVQPTVVLAASDSQGAAGAAKDLAMLQQTGWLTLTIGQKKYHEIP